MCKGYQIYFWIQGFEAGFLKASLGILNKVDYKSFPDKYAAYIKAIDHSILWHHYYEGIMQI